MHDSLWDQGLLGLACTVQFARSWNSLYKWEVGTACASVQLLVHASHSAQPSVFWWLWWMPVKSIADMKGGRG